MRVVDASVMVDVVLQTARGRAALPLLDDDLVAPDLLVAEVLHVLRRHALARTVPPARVRTAVHAFAEADVEYLPTWPYTRRIWELRGRLSAYDAAYVALAEDLQAPLLTADRALAAVAGVPVLLPPS